MNYHDYIWDLGGTLLDNYEMSTQAFVKTLADFGCQASHDDFYEKLKESFLKAYKALEADYLKTPVLFTGASEVLQAIVASGGRNFLVSHRNKQVLDILEKTKVLPYFTEVVTSESGFARKPNPESMLYLKEKYKIDNALVIGDREIDKEAGQAAGFDTLLVDGKKSLLEIVK